MASASPIDRRCPYCGGLIRFPMNNYQLIRFGGGFLGECEVCGSQFSFKTEKR